MKLFAIFLAILSSSCTPKKILDSSPPAIQITHKNEMTIDWSLPFKNHLQLVTVEPVLGSVPVREQAQIIATMDSLFSFKVNNSSFSEHWIYLNENFEGKVRELAKTSSISNSKILISMNTPKEIAAEIRMGMDVSILRYGVKVNPQIGKIVGMIPSDNDEFTHVFIGLMKQTGWTLGTVCTVELPLKNVKPVLVPLLSVLQIKDEEFVLKEISEGVFDPKHVTVLSQDETSFKVIGLKPKDRVIGSGAILLKPIAEQILEPALEKKP